MVRCFQCLIPLQKVKVPKYLQTRADVCLRQRCLPTRWCSEPTVPPLAELREAWLCLAMACFSLVSKPALLWPLFYKSLSFQPRTNL